MHQIGLEGGNRHDHLVSGLDSQLVQPPPHLVVAPSTPHVVANDDGGGVPVKHVSHGPEIGLTRRVPNLHLAGDVFAALDPLGDEGGAHGGLSGVFAVVALGEAGDEGGFANVGGAEDD